jgi:hypothetical protein
LVVHASERCEVNGRRRSVSVGRTAAGGQALDQRGEPSRPFGMAITGGVFGEPAVVDDVENRRLPRDA